MFGNWSTAFDANIRNVTVTIPPAATVMSIFGWIIVQQRIASSTDWNRDWYRYKVGFGSNDDDFWLGLKELHDLTSSQPYRLRIEVKPS